MVEATDGEDRVAEARVPGEGAPSSSASLAEADVDGLGVIDGLDAGDADTEGAVIERAVLNDSEAGRQIQAAFIDIFGRYMRDDVRPLLRDVAVAGNQPQLLVNGLAELLRSVARKIEFPLDHPRSGFPPQVPGAPGAGERSTG